MFGGYLPHRSNSVGKSQCLCDHILLSAFYPLRKYHNIQQIIVWTIILLEKMTGRQLRKKFPTFRGFQR